MKIKTCACTFTITLLLASTCSALDNSDFPQNSAQPAKWWTNLTAGRGMLNRHNTHSVGTSLGLGLGFSFNGAFSDNAFGTIYRHTVDGKYQNEASDFGIMAGYRWNKSKGYIAVSSGIGYMNKYTYSYPYWDTIYYSKEYDGVMVPVQLQAFWTPFKHFGFGITAHTTLGKENYGSVQLGFQIYA